MGSLLNKNLKELRFVADTVNYIVSVDVCDNQSYAMVNGLLNQLVEDMGYSKEELTKVYCMLYRKDEEYGKVLNILNFF